MAHVITANDLKGGLVVYQTPENGWTESVRVAEVLTDEVSLAAGLKRAKVAEDCQLVVGIYEIEVETVDGDLRPTRYRERIRAFGPSTHPEFSRQPDPAEAR